MLYSLTNFSIFERFECVGAQTIMGMPVVLAYSNLFLMSSISSVGKLTFPPLMILRPAFSNSLRPFSHSERGEAMSRWNSLMLTYGVWICLIILMARARWNWRSE